MSYICGRELIQMKHEQEYFPNETNEKSFGFKVILTLVGLMLLAIIGVRLYMLQTFDVLPDPTLESQVEPLWYSITAIVLAIISIFGLILTWNFRKLGVYITSIGLFLIVVLNPDFELFSTLAPLFTLFVFLGYGMFEIIPKWRFFK